MFLLLIEFGYVAGIASKFVRPDFVDWFAKSWYVLIFYILNFIMVGADLVLYFKNKKLDKLSEELIITKKQGVVRTSLK